MKRPTPNQKISRRRFLVATGAAVSLPTFIPASALGLNGSTAPSERITMGMVGCGNMGSGNNQSFLALKECQVVAACDVDKKHLQRLVGAVNKKYDNKDCKSYHDYREVMARKDIDAVMIAL